MNLNYITFNQDSSHVGVATKAGFRVYTTEPFAKTYHNDEGDVALLEMLFSTTLVATVTSPRLLTITNTKRGSTICELSFPSKINAVRINRKRLVIVLDSSIWIYDMSNMKSLQVLDTPSNPLALCALSSSSESNILVYPCPLVVSTSGPKKPAHVPPGSQSYHNTTSQNAGDVRVYDATTLEAVNTIQAHQSSIGCLALNHDGTLLATASEKGTIIRVFSIPSGENLFQFRRGTMPAHIYHMSFNATSTLLCVSSATETVHIFRLINPPKASSGSPTGATDERPSHRRNLSDASFHSRGESPGDENMSESGMTNDLSKPSLERRPSTFTESLASRIRQVSRDVATGVSSRMGTYLPASVTQALEPQRDFAHVKIPKVATVNSVGPLRSIVAMSSGHPQLIVVTSEGAFGVYNIDLEKGGEGVLERQESVLESVSSTGFGSED